MLFDGKLDAVDFMAITHHEEQVRKEKLEYIVKAVRECGDEVVDITPICNNLDIRLTPDEYSWILDQIQD